MMNFKHILTAFCLLLAGGIFQPAAADNLPVVPRPLNMSVGEGSFLFKPTTTFGVENAVQLKMVSAFAERFGASAGFVPAVSIGNNSSDVTFVTDSSLSSEAYSLKVTADGITVKAADNSGFFYALQTLRQLLPAAIDGKTATDEPMKVPVMEITDSPRFGYRGVMVDVSRYFLPKSDLLKVIDVAAMLKLNKLHLHLVDDTGWRLEIEKYPLLTQVGAWRVKRDEPFPDRRCQQEGELTPVGGYYTKDDIREIVAYAADRQMEVIPEIEMPAHTNSSLAAYPELACPVVDIPITVLPGLGVKNSRIVYCAGNDSVFSFLEDVIDEVIELFPSKYIHLGGDEASKYYWEKCPKCQARMKAEGIEHIEELQSYFMRRMSKYVQSKGKEVMGWDELTNSTLPDDVIIFGWQGLGKAALKAAEQGHRFVMTPARVLYLIRYQGPQWFEPLTYFGNNTLKDVYNYEPVQSDWKPEYADLLMGVQGSLWTEFCNSPEDVNYLLYPRLMALADVAWTPKETKDWQGFLKGVDNVLPHLDAMGVGYARSMYNIDHKVTPDNGKLSVEMSCIRPDVEIRYTTDGSEPTAGSKLYKSPVTVKKDGVLKAATFMGGEQKGMTLKLDLRFNKATGKNVITKNDKTYALTNGLRGSDRHSDFEWAGWYAQDASFTVDLGKRMDVSSVTLGNVTNSAMGVHQPAVVRLSVSDDNKTFRTVKELTISTEEVFRHRWAIEDILLNGFKAKARYLKIDATNPGKCPVGDVREGQDVWMYFDEIIVK